MKILSKHLYIVSTPIGNLDDITLRALEVLKNSDIILCEDTRRSIKLLSHYKIKKKLISYHKFNEKKQLTKIIEYFNEGKILSLISDAGTPLLSDPGRLLVNRCVETGIQITPIPGVSSVTASISVSGFKDQFLFYGFLPKTQNELDKVLVSLSQSNYTQVFFVPSKKINFYINNFKKYFSGRKIVIAKEITKIHEAFIREDIDGDNLIEAHIKHISNTDRGTNLDNGSFRIHTSEHVLAALTGLDIDNCYISLDGAEVPIMDGSSKFFIEAIENAKIVEQNALREEFFPTEKISYECENTGSKISIIPDKNYSLESKSFNATKIIDDLLKDDKGPERKKIFSKNLRKKGKDCKCAKGCVDQS